MWNRRHFVAVCAGVGLGGTVLPGVLLTLAQEQPRVTKDMIDAAANIADVTIPDEYKDAMLQGLNNVEQGYEAVYNLHMTNGVQPAILFDPLPMGAKVSTAKAEMVISSAPAVATRAPKNIEDCAFMTVRQLAELVKSKQVSSVALTEMYLERLKRYNSKLLFYVNLTEDRAKTQAAAADKEIAAGKYRGLLHGIPWGAKDLVAVKGYPTTWGAGGFEHQMINEDATVVQRLDRAGAVLVAKLTAGALASGDFWFGGQTRNPWLPAQGSSGSSAGPASATAAGCVGFSVGTETRGSISSPSTRCGVTGFRPTFGLVPRTGVMALSWTIDKVGPICRSVEDCAIVTNYIHGQDGKDRSVQPAAFNWNAQFNWKSLRVGVLQKDFDVAPYTPPAPPKPVDQMTAEEKQQYDARVGRGQLQYNARAADHAFDVAALEKLKSMGVKMAPVQLPAEFTPVLTGAMEQILEAEAAAASDELTRTGRDKLLTRQTAQDWPNRFRTSRFIPAVEYVQANRVRMLLIEAMAKVFENLDLIVSPTNGPQVTLTNLSGHPAVIVPNGFRSAETPMPNNNNPNAGGGPGTPVSLTFLGNLYSDAKLLAFARAYQNATTFHLTHPNLDA
jgi:Asp-tRNA(Asn)/Glu-tRNA(Gln) amidotransferase A subunit family amidase